MTADHQNSDFWRGEAQKASKKVLGKIDPEFMIGWLATIAADQAAVIRVLDDGFCPGFARVGNPGPRKERKKEKAPA